MVNINGPSKLDNGKCEFWELLVQLVTAMLIPNFIMSSTGGGQNEGTVTSEESIIY